MPESLDTTDDHRAASGAHPALGCRSARVRDAARLAAIQVDSWENTYRGKLPDAVIDARTYAARTAAWTRILTEPARREADDGARRADTLVCTANGREAGFLDFGPPRCATDHRPRTVEITSCYVAPWAWRRGVGRTLWHALVERCLPCGNTHGLLWVLRDNPRAIGFYEAMGLRLDGTARDEHMAGTAVPHVRMVGALGTP